MPPEADVLTRWPEVRRHPEASAWLRLQTDLGLAARTIDAYGRALDEYLATCVAAGVEPSKATRADVTHYVRELSTRPHRRGANVVSVDSGVGLANATLRLRLVAVRLFHDYLVEEGVRADNPVGRGRYTAGKAFGGHRRRGLIPRFTKLPWIPTDEQWHLILEASRSEGARNRLMLALGYDAGLRREELCSLRTDDIDPAHQTVRVRAETTKGRRERVIPYSAACSSLLQAYLVHRRTVSTARGPLFLSESRRNHGRPITLWTWSKVVRAIAVRAGVPGFSTHTLRHLCLTDLARSGWELHAIATFAGHRDTNTTLQYIHLSGRDLARRLEASMASVHAWRTELTVDVIS